MQDQVYAAVLAAGLGKRMKSALPKVLHPLLGRPMLAYVLDALRPLAPEETVLIVGHGAQQVQEIFGSSFRYALQEVQMGTGHALRQAKPFLSERKGILLILPGDIPLLRSEHLEALLQAHCRSEALATVLTAEVDDPSMLGRVRRSPLGDFLDIVEEADASPEELTIREVSTSVYAFALPAVLAYLDRIQPQNAQGEYYLTDVLSLARRDGRVEAITVKDIPIIGVNDRAQLSQCRKVLHDRLLTHWMKEGVSIEDPATVSLDWDVRIGADTVIRPFTMLEGNTRIGSHCQVGPFVHLRDSQVPEGTQIIDTLERREEP